MESGISGVLRSCPLFAKLDEASLGQLEQISRVRQYDKGQAIFREGDAPPGLFVVGRGMVRVFKLSPGGKDHVLHLAGPGQTFAEVAVLGSFACPAHAEAVEATECVLLPAGPFRRALRNDHELCLRLMAGMSQWVRYLVNRIEDIVLRDATGRVARYLLAARDAGSNTINLPGLKKHLASHLNLTSETLSRTLRRLLEAGLIEEELDQSLRVLDPVAMQDAAEGLFPQL